MPARALALALGLWALGVAAPATASADEGVIHTAVGTSSTSLGYVDADGSNGDSLPAEGSLVAGERATHAYATLPNNVRVIWALGRQATSFGDATVLYEYAVDPETGRPIPNDAPLKLEIGFGCEEPYWIPPRTIVCTTYNGTTFKYELVKFTISADGSEIVGGPTPLQPATPSLAGGGRTTLAAVDGSFVFPSYSPVTKRIVAWNVADDSIWIMDEDGANAMPLTGSGESRRHPSINEQGTVVFYSRNFEIWSVNADGSGGEVPVTSGSCCDAGPSLGPDGEVYFHRKAGGALDDFEIYAVKPNGTGLRPLTDNDDVDDLFPQPFALEPSGDPGDPGDSAACTKAKQALKKAKKKAKKAKKAEKKAKQALKKAKKRGSKGKVRKAAKKLKKAKTKAKKAKKKQKARRKAKKKSC